MQATLAAWAVVSLLSFSQAALAASPVQVENSLPGSPEWAALRPTAEIEGYAAHTSVVPGETLAFHVASRSSAARYRIDIYRLGWYAGLGARRVACLPACWADSAVMPQPPAPAPDPTTGEVAAAWPVTDVLAVPSDWVSGYYEARIVVTAGEHAGLAHPVYFVVREPPGHDSAVLVQAPLNTWQAYNNWGGKSLYGFNSTGGLRANHVSFDRPYELPPIPGAQATPLPWEIQVVRFLEREGVDVSYQTDVDTDREPSSLLRHRLVMTVGHSEYWTKGMRDAFEAARDDGTNLAFMGSNNAYWQIRYENDRQTIVAYKSWADPIADRSLATVLFRDLGRPECALVGVMHLDSLGLTDYAVNPRALGDAWFAGTGFDASSTLPAIVGLEYDAVPDVPPAGCLPTTQIVFFEHRGPPGNAHAVRYVAPSGARVFASGTMQFSWALDEFGLENHPHRPHDPRVQAFMRNALADLGRPAAPDALSATARVGSVALATVTRPDPRVEIVIVRREGQDVFDPRTDGVVVCRTASCVDTDVLGHRTYRYAAFARDRWGSSSPVFSEPAAVPNTPPTVTLRGPARAVVGRRLTLRAAAQDADGDKCLFRWSVNSRRAVGTGPRLTIRPRRPGTHRIVVVADDEHGGVTSARRTVHVRPAPRTPRGSATP